MLRVAVTILVIGILLQIAVNLLRPLLPVLIVAALLVLGLWIRRIYRTYW
jgi:hypothetical protein